MKGFIHQCNTKPKKSELELLRGCWRWQTLLTAEKDTTRSEQFRNNDFISVLARHFFFLSAILIGIVVSIPAMAQTTLRVDGTVLDEKGVTLPGVSVLVKGSSAGTSTNADGKFSLNAKSGETLVFSFIGYNTSEVVVNNSRSITVRLTPNQSSLEEVVVVGYGTKKKETLTGAVSSVTSKEIVVTKNENVQNMLSGKVAGLRVVQNTAEPGSFDTNFEIRGMGAPLIIIDGIPRNNMNRLNANDIESVSILKDASAAIYGVRAANGVVLITTKKGKKSSLSLDYTGSYAMQFMQKLPESAGIVDYLTLVNERNMHNVNGGTRLYSDEVIEEYRNGTRPSTDWQSLALKNFAPQYYSDLSASGGNETTQYFASLGYTRQQGIFQSNDLNYERYNLRSNITTKVSKSLTFDVNLNGIMDEREQPYQAPWWIFRSLWYQAPVNLQYANNNPAYLNNVPSGLHGPAQAEKDIAGYITNNKRWFQSSLSLNYEVPFIQGLNIKGLYSYDWQQENNKFYYKSFNLYNYNASTDTYVPQTQQAPSFVKREFYEYPQSLGQLQLNYSRSFLGAHNVAATLIYENTRRRGDNFSAQREVSIPIDQLMAGNSANQIASMSTSANALYENAMSAYIGRFSYDYKGRYLVEFGFREDGSSRFAAGKQWGFFPFASGGWRISEEGFWKNSSLLSKVNNFKLRASYGELGDESGLSYQFLTGYNYPAGGSPGGLPAGSVFDGTFINGVASRGLANPLLSWYTAKTIDFGVDFEAWNGLFGFTVDYFQRDRSGLNTTRGATLPDVVGAGLPQENINGDRTKGIDFDISHRNKVGDFNYNFKAIFGFARTMNTYREQARQGNSWLNWWNNNGGANVNDRWNNVYWGYGADGRFESYRDIENSDTFVSRNTVVGDYRYQDWNGDGNITSQDAHPIATSGFPTLTYGLNFGASFKNIDFSMNWAGAGQVYASYIEQLREPLWAGGNALVQFLDRWRPTDPNADPYDPNTEWISGHYAYTGTLPFVNTMHNASNAAYIRLKSVELGYTVPSKYLARAGLKGLRVYANGYNLLTFTKLKYLDPERPPSRDFGYWYPVDRKFTFGLNLQL